MDCYLAHYGLEPWSIDFQKCDLEGGMCICFRSTGSRRREVIAHYGGEPWSVISKIRPCAVESYLVHHTAPRYGLEVSRVISHIVALSRGGLSPTYGFGPLIIIRHSVVLRREMLYLALRICSVEQNVSYITALGHQRLCRSTLPPSTLISYMTAWRRVV